MLTPNSFEVGPLHCGAQRTRCVYELGSMGGRRPPQVDASVRVATSPPAADELPGPMPTDARPAAKDRIAFVDIGRALAALLVFYSHIHVVWMRGTTASRRQ